MDQDETRHAGRPRPWPHCVRWGPTYLPLRGKPPNFWPISVAAKWLHGSRCHLVWRKAPAQATLCSMGTLLPLPKRGHSPQISGPCLLWPNGWMDQDGIWHRGRPQPRRLCVRWGPSPLPNFRPIYIVAKQCDSR